MHDKHYNAYKIGLLTQSARADVLQLEDDDGNDSWPLWLLQMNLQHGRMSSAIRYNIPPTAQVRTGIESVIRHHLIVLWPFVITPK